MIIFMALADGESRLLCGPLTLHTETAIHIAEKMTGAKFKVSGYIEEWEGESGFHQVAYETFSFYAGGGEPWHRQLLVDNLQGHRV